MPLPRFSVRGALELSVAKGQTRRRDPRVAIKRSRRVKCDAEKGGIRPPQSGGRSIGSRSWGFGKGEPPIKLRFRRDGKRRSFRLQSGAKECRHRRALLYLRARKWQPSEGWSSPRRQTESTTSPTASTIFGTPGGAEGSRGQIWNAARAPSHTGADGVYQSVLLQSRGALTSQARDIESFVAFDTAKQKHPLEIHKESRDDESQLLARSRIRQSVGCMLR